MLPGRADIARHATDLPGLMQRDGAVQQEDFGVAGLVRSARASSGLAEGVTGGKTLQPTCVVDTAGRFWPRRARSCANARSVVWASLGGAEECRGSPGKSPGNRKRV